MGNTGKLREVKRERRREERRKEKFREKESAGKNEYSYSYKRK